MVEHGIQRRRQSRLYACHPTTFSQSEFDNTHDPDLSPANNKLITLCGMMPTRAASCISRLAGSMWLETSAPSCGKNLGQVDAVHQEDQPGGTQSIPGVVLMALSRPQMWPPASQRQCMSPFFVSPSLSLPRNEFLRCVRLGLVACSDAAVGQYPTQDWFLKIPMLLLKRDVWPLNTPCRRSAAANLCRRGWQCCYVALLSLQSRSNGHTQMRIGMNLAPIQHQPCPAVEPPPALWTNRVEASVREAERAQSRRWLVDHGENCEK